MKLKRAKTTKNSLEIESPKTMAPSSDFGAGQCYLMAQRIWLVLLVSLPLDLFIYQNHLNGDYPQDTSGNLHTITLGLLLLSMLGLIPEKLLAFVDTLRRATAKQGPSLKRALIPLALISVIAVFEVLIRVGSLGLLPVLIGVGVILMGLPSQLKTFKAIRERFIQFKNDPASWIKQLNLQMLYVWAVPLACARLVSLSAAINSSFILQGEEYYSLFGGVALILMLVQKPQRIFFLASCRTCATPTARALYGLGFCPNCAPERFGAMVTKPQPKETDSEKKERLAKQRALQELDAKALVAQLLKRLFSLEPAPLPEAKDSAERSKNPSSSTPSTLNKEK